MDGISSADPVLCVILICSHMTKVHPWPTGNSPYTCTAASAHHHIPLPLPLPREICSLALHQGMHTRGPSMARLASCAGVRAAHPSSISDRLACLTSAQILLGFFQHLARMEYNCHTFQLCFLDLSIGYRSSYLRTCGGCSTC
jgi:hypothetical protein